MWSFVPIADDQLGTSVLRWADEQANEVRDLIYHLPVPWTQIRNVSCWGHSLGGAVATVLAHKMSVDDPTRNISVMTFGEPRLLEPILMVHYNIITGLSLVKMVLLAQSFATQ